MLPLLRADFFKIHKSGTLWGLWTIMVLLVAGDMFLGVLIDSTSVAYPFPISLLSVGFVMQGLGVLLLLFFSADIVGTEYSRDTWKNLLIRYPGRVNFILSKWLTIMISSIIGLLAMLLFAGVFGLVLQATFHLTGHVEALSPGTVLLIVLTQSLFAVEVGLITLMGTVLGRSTIVGIIIGIFWLILDLSIPELLPDPLKLMSFSLVCRSLQAHAMGTATPYAVLPDLLIVAAYLILPVAIAANVFRQRDILGPG